MASSRSETGVPLLFATARVSRAATFSRVLHWTLPLGPPRLAFADGPQGQLTWAIHISLAPTWFVPAETSGDITPFMVLYAVALRQW